VNEAWTVSPGRSQDIVLFENDAEFAAVTGRTMRALILVVDSALVPVPLLRFVDGSDE